MHPSRQIRLWAAILLILLPASSASAATEEVEKTLYEQSYTEVKESFDDLKSKVDDVAERLDKFQEAMDTWRRATTREAQKRGIDGIDELLDNLNEDALKKLIETGLGEEAVKRLEEIEEALGIQLSDHVNLLELFHRDPRKAFDYMYNLSASERYFRKNGLFDKVRAVRVHMEKGAAYLKRAGDMVEFVALFDPTRADDDAPTASLKRIKGVLEYSKKFTDKIPALGHLIDFYAEACDAFVGALDRLDKKLKEARQGALCGQMGTEKPVQRAFAADCGGCDCLTFLSMDAENAGLKPIRAWEGIESGRVFLFLDDTRHTLLDGASFRILHAYQTALASSDAPSNRRFAAPETLISTAMGIARSIAGHDRSFREYHRIVDGDTSQGFRKILESEGVIKDHWLAAADGARYRLGSGRQDEFAALCFFSGEFRKLVKDIIGRYGNRVAISGTVAPEDADDLLASAEIQVDGEPAREVRCTENRCQFRALVRKNQPFGIRVKAPGYREFSKDGYLANDLYDSVPPITLQKREPDKPVSIRINGPDRVEKGTAATFSLAVEGGPAPLKTLAIRWFDVDANAALGKGDRIEITPEIPGTLRIRAVVWARAGKGQQRIGQADHVLAVMGPAGAQEGSPPDDAGKAPEKTSTPGATGEKESAPKKGTQEPRTPDPPREREPAKTAPTPAPPDNGKNPSPPVDPEPGDAAPGGSNGMAAVPLDQLSFSGTAPSIWQEQKSDRKLHLKRTEASAPGNSKLCPNPATVFGELWAKIGPSFAPRSPEEIRQKLDYDMEEHERYGRNPAIRPFAVGEFKGWMLDTQVKFRGGGWSSDAGYRRCSSSAYGHGFAIKDNHCIEVYYGIGGSGCFNNSHQPFLESQTAAAQAEAKSILAGLSLTVNGAIQSVPYTGPKLDGSETPMVRLVPESLDPLQVGAGVTVKALVENVKPEDAPYAFTWSGDADGTGDEAALKTDKPGKFTASVSVAGARYPLGSAAIEYEVSDLKAVVERVGADAPVPVGGTASFKATLLSGGKPASGDYVYHWQPHPEVRFKDPEGTQPAAVATFSRTGTIGVWVQVLERKGNTLATVAESDPVEIEVIQPELALAASPEAPRVGEPVTLTATLTPPMDEALVSLWWEIQGNALNTGPLEKGRAYSFIPKDTRPVTVTVHAKARDGGEVLGEASRAVTAREYTVTVSAPRSMGPTPRIWKPGVGLVDAPGGIAVFQDVFVRAVVTPAPSGSVRYRWSVTPEGCTLASPFSQETRAQASRTGTFEVAAAVTDARGVLLGTGRGQIPVTISQEQLAAGKNREAAAATLKTATSEWEAGHVETAVKAINEALGLAPRDPDVSRLHRSYSDKAKRIETRMKAAREKARIGKLDEALALAGEALSENPKNQAVTDYIDQVEAARADIARKLQEIEGLIQASEFLRAQNQLIPLKNAYCYHPPIQAMEVRLGDAWREWESRVNTALGNIRLTYEKRDFKEALDLIDETRKSLKLLPGHLETLAAAENYCRGQEAAKEKARQRFAAGKAKLAAYDYGGAVREFQEGFQISQNLWNVNTDPTPAEAGKLLAEATARKKELDGHLQVVHIALHKAPGPGLANIFENAIGRCDEARTLQPNNPDIPRYRAALEEKWRQAEAAAGKKRPAPEASPSATPPNLPEASAPTAAKSPLPNPQSPSVSSGAIDGSSEKGATPHPPAVTTGRSEPGNGRADRDITGTWKDESAEGEWTFRPEGPGRYQAAFKGDTDGTGTAAVKGDRISIDLTVYDISVHYDLILSKDGGSAAGEWRSSDGDTEKATLVKVN